VQINAFNFPVWGPLEKLAPAFLAGVPSLIKPASPTAYVTHRLVELLVQSQLLPEGSLQLIAGSAGDLLEHLTEQDLLGFTGSAATALKLRTHPTVAVSAVRFTAEADSLNCSVLGPDAVPDTPEFELFVKGLTTEMTVKAGQKCTAIRRALVPDHLLDAVAEAAAARLERVTIGNPADPDVRMGALSGVDQRQEVHGSVKALTGAGTIVFGNPDRVEVVDADPERGAFLSPILLRADGDRAEPHEVEAFGPVSTLIGYGTAAQAITLAARGKGSLVGSVVTADADFARELVLGAHHGTDGYWCSTATTPRNPPATGHRYRTWCTAAQASGRRRRGAGRDARGAAPHATHRGAGLPQGAHRHHRPMDTRGRADRYSRAPLP